MNAGGVPNTCKSSGKAFTVCLNGETGRGSFVRNFRILKRSDELRSAPIQLKAEEEFKESVKVHERRTAE